jgi:hypothetical protein
MKLSRVSESPLDCKQTKPGFVEGLDSLGEGKTNAALTVLAPRIEACHGDNRHADFAVGWSDRAWTLHAEGLIAAPIARADLDWGATMLAARRVSVERAAIVLEPVIAADAQVSEERRLRGTVALNVHHDGWHLFETVAWEATSLPGGHVGHRVLLQVQAGL